MAELNGPPSTPFEASVPLPGSLDTRVHLSLTIRERSVLVFVTTATPDSKEAISMGSFVYALPNVLNPKEPLSTTLFTAESSLDLASRLAKLLAVKTQLPVYVSNSVRLESTVLGGTVEEEMEVFREIVKTAVEAVHSVLPPSI